MCRRNGSSNFFLDLKVDLVKVQMRDNYWWAVIKLSSCTTFSKVKWVVVFLITNILSIHDRLTVASQIGGSMERGVC